MCIYIINLTLSHLTTLQKYGFDLENSKKQQFIDAKTCRRAEDSLGSVAKNTQTNSESRRDLTTFWWQHHTTYDYTYTAYVTFIFKKLSITHHPSPTRDASDLRSSPASAASNGGCVPPSSDSPVPATNGGTQTKTTRLLSNGGLL